MELTNIQEADKLQETLEKALEDDSVSKIYANGFVTATGHGDIMVLLQRNGKHVSVLNLSFSVAKTLALSLGKTIQDLEQKTEKDIMTTFDIQKALGKGEKGKGGKDV